ncbi:MAG: hypothetical protein KH415_20205 [Clostridium sp.]|nr:hypothetical protein [Clostridium sp.]
MGQLNSMVTDGYKELLKEMNEKDKEDKELSRKIQLLSSIKKIFVWVKIIAFLIVILIFTNILIVFKL